MTSKIIIRTAVITKDGDSLSPIQPSLRLEEMSERARLRARAAKVIRSDRIALIAHQRMMTWLDRREMLA